MCSSDLGSGARHLTGAFHHGVEVAGLSHLCAYAKSRGCFVVHHNHARGVFVLAFVFMLRVCVSLVAVFVVVIVSLGMLMPVFVLMLMSLCMFVFVLMFVFSVSVCTACKSDCRCDEEDM